nr:hypothetical protein K-LCC10_0491 [Kaumoebavirus]
MSSPTQLIIDARADGDTFPRFTLAVDGTMVMGSGTAEGDVGLYRKGDGELGLIGRLDAPMFSVGTNNHVKVDGINCFVGGQDSVVGGLNNVSWGSGCQITTEGEANFCLGSGTIQNAGEIRSNYSTILGAGIATGSDHCVVVGGYATKSFGCLVVDGTVNDCDNTTLIGNAEITGVTGSIVLNSPGEVLGEIEDHSLYAQMSGGYWFGTAPGIGMHISPGTASWRSVGDERVRKVARRVESREEVLLGLDKLSLCVYRDGAIGPSTQGFYGSFGEHLGKSAVIHNGMEMLDDRDEKTTLWMICKELRKENMELKRRLDDLEEALGIVAFH